MITEQQKDDVQRTFALVAQDADGAAALFYQRLFEIDPTLKLLFKSDMKDQGRKLMQMISVAVKALDRLEAIIPAVEDLGQRHVAYGVTKAHYVTVGAALLWTLEQGLGTEFTPAVKDAWAHVYTLLADVATAKVYEPTTA